MVRAIPRRASLISFGAVAVGALMLLLTVQSASATHTIISVSPSSGPTAGGTVITITGTDFPTNVDLEVTVGEIEATNVSVNVEGTMITATTPPHAAGAVNVVVTDTSGESDSETRVNGFTYIDTPEVIGLSPNTGIEEGGTVASIFGNHFVAGATVTFGETAATNVTFVDDHELTATAPAGTGTVDVTVTNPDEQTSTLPDAFTYTEEEDTTGEIISGGIPAGGFGLFVFGGGTNEQLVDASGCPEATVTFYATNAQGGFVTYIPGSNVQAVNAAWNALFPSGIPAMTALIGKCA